MLKTRQLFVTLAALSLAGQPALAADNKDTSDKCAMQEAVYVVVSFNVLAKSNAEAKKKFDERVAHIDDAAQEIGVSKIWLQTLNYSIASQMINFDNGTPEPGFMVSSSGNYQVDKFDNAAKLSDALLKEHYLTTINVNRFRKPDCHVDFNK